MKTIHKHTERQGLLELIDKRASTAIDAGLAFTVEYRDNGITEAQFKAMHVWIHHCVKYLNDLCLYRCSPVSGKKIPWTDLAFKEDVYKVVLKAMTNKTTTKKQNTIEPNDIVLCISGHMATGYERNVCLPAWPSNR